MERPQSRDGLRSLSTRLIVLCLGMVVAGLALPSPVVSTHSGAAGKPDTTSYHPLRRPAAPADVIVPSLGVRAPVRPIEVLDSVLTPPPDATTVGWWRDSARAGARRGQTVITGHTVRAGGGAFNDLGGIHRGAIIRVRALRGPLMDYRATGTVVYTREELARHAHDLFNQDRAEPRLVLITCTGWNGSSYNSNVVVFAEPLGVRSRSVTVDG